MNADITEILSALVQLALALAVAFIVPWVKKQTGNAELTELLKWADIAVAAAEQLYESTQGEVKKKYVLGFLESKGYTIDENDLNEIIEAAVNRLHKELTKNG